jgi:hypothetical protein
MRQSQSRPWRSTPTGPRFAAIDIGSDTVHLLIADLLARPSTRIGREAGIDPGRVALLARAS